MTISSSYLLRTTVFLLLLSSGGVAWSACNTDGSQTGASSVVFLQGNGGFTCSQAAGDNGQIMRPASGFSYSKNGNSGISWSATEQVDKIFAAASGQGSRCLYEFEPGLLEGISLFPTNAKTVVACTDGVDDIASVLIPTIGLEKKVVRADIKDEAGSTLPVNCFDQDGNFSEEAADEINVIAPGEYVYCYQVANSGAGDAEAVTLDDPLVNFNENLGTIASGSDPVTRVSDIVTLSVDGCGSYPDPCIDVGNSSEVLNTASVSTVFSGDCLGNCEDSDSATVNIIVSCDPDTQEEANETGTVVERRSINGDTRCGPKENLVDPSSVALLCDGTCELKPECAATTGQLPEHCAQPCKPSFNWNTYGEAGVCVSGTPTPGNLPLCQEVLTNPDNLAGCNPGDIAIPAFIRSDGHAVAFRKNPALYYFPASGGGNSIGTIYCILYPGETSRSCPAGSIVY